MDRPGWSKSPPELVEVFEAVFPGPPAVARPMFGYPAGFVNGNMFMSLHQEHMVLRLPDGPRAELLAAEGAGTFEPMAGRPMKEYVTVPASLLASPEELEPWVARALAYGASLPPKAAKDKAKAKARAKPN
jgi:TfoX/Sxy family transcriptional regulator of competence genes